jgi:hypothetical protein
MSETKTTALLPQAALIIFVCPEHSRDKRKKFSLCALCDSVVKDNLVETGKTISDESQERKNLTGRTKMGHLVSFAQKIPYIHIRSIISTS